MLRRGYGITGTANDMLKKFRENECITNYFRVKTEIEQQIDELQKLEPRFFCRKCVTLKELIVAENKRFNKCYLSNSRQLKLIDNEENIKSFTEECIEYQKCVHNRTPSVRKNVRSGRAPTGKAMHQSRGNSKTSKPGSLQIKGPSGQDQKGAGGKALTKANPIPQNPDGINSSRNSGEAQDEASKIITNLPSSTSGRMETQAQKLSQSVHHPVSGTDTHPSGSIEGTPNGQDHLLKYNQLIDLGKGTSQSNSPSDQVAEGQVLKNQDPGDVTSITEITNIGDPAIKVVDKVPVVRSSVDRVACSNTPDGKETCDEKAVIKDSSPVPSYDVSTDVDFNLDEYPCSEEDIHELFGSETLRVEARGREDSRIKVTGNEEPGVVLNAVMLRPSTDENTEHAVSSQGHMASRSERDSELKTYQSTGPIISSSRCVPSIRTEESAFSPLKEMCSEEQNNKDQLLSREDSHQRDQLNKQESVQQEGQLHSEKGSSIQEEEHSGGKHYIIKDIVQHLHPQKNCGLRQSIYFSRRERSIYTNKFICI
ncbi:VIR protein [Plasmodium vivax]|uniref:VIR protein n=1 Tax=Plasmodium vivax TaxID=5855 RepID=A0A1G4EA55_PLAVI|nr:VIR protein [Plasmodium vivax]